ncbi:MAG TPA: gluconate 2-dehydrogenase subunit 3 family protein [Bryobacteraceae bacterium]|jgi:hypothetical protein|nr:gluconate 2-dehydrogenase subunit 3 family protein [Bryobacteraceae bacterium]
MSSAITKPVHQPLTDPATDKPLPPRKQPGYYPGYSTLGQQQWWDATTRQTVLDRVNNVPPIRFFSPEELPVIGAVVERIIPQDDRTPERKIPVLHYIDQRLHEDKIDGYRYEDMPSDQDAYRLAIRIIDTTAQEIHGQPFFELDRLKQDFLVKSIHDGKKLAAFDLWDKLSIHHFWAMLVSDCVKAYYSHPWAWDEVGFGGPAYPRAYMRLEGGQPEPWEVDEQRYEWSAPTDTISDNTEPASVSSHSSHPGQGGTH